MPRGGCHKTPDVKKSTRPPRAGNANEPTAKSRRRNVPSDLRRALRGLRDRLPQYELPEGAPAADGDGGGTPSGDAGPLASVRIVPAEVVVRAGGEQRVHAIAEDAAGRSLSSVTFSW